MNSLNLISSKVIGPASSTSAVNIAGSSPIARRRSRSQGELFPSAQQRSAESIRSRSLSAQPLFDNDKGSNAVSDQVSRRDDSDDNRPGTSDSNSIADDEPSEKTPLLLNDEQERTSYTAGEVDKSRNRLYYLARRIYDALAESFRIIFSALIAPGAYAARSFRDEQGRLSPLGPVKKLRHYLKGTEPNETGTAMAHRSSRNSTTATAASARPRRNTSAKKLSAAANSRDSVYTSASESDMNAANKHRKRPSVGAEPRHTRSKSTAMSSSSDDTVPTRRSIRIKVNDDDTMRRRKQRKAKAAAIAEGIEPSSATASATDLTVDNIKSPTSPHAASLRMTKYPQAPAPPRPLIPRRQPSYTSAVPNINPLHPSTFQKTLILDLDETLIHSLSKGGRMSSGHMVEVKLANPVSMPVASIDNTQHNQQITAQAYTQSHHPILYYVHKRPHCDDFLRKVCKWYKLVIFTASVQEYADPVIDWLEQERKFFHARYYRQHCTLRNGAYVKDLSSVEPDLSRVMILDNSPLSYIFHEGAFYSSCSLLNRFSERQLSNKIKQTTQSQFQVGSTIPQTTICFTLFQCSRAFNTSRMYVLYSHYAAVKSKPRRNWVEMMV